jgi:hypothetical protein
VSDIGAALVAVGLMVLAASLCAYSCRRGRDVGIEQGREQLCAEQFHGVMFGGECVVPDSIQRVEP